MSDDSLLGAQVDTASGEGSGEGASGAPAAQDTGQQGAVGGAQGPGAAQGQADDDSLLSGAAAEGDKKAEGEGEGDKKAEGEGGKKAEGEGDKDVITPESYGDFTTPEGMLVNEALLGEFKTVAAELKLTKDAAQRLVDLQVKNVQAQVQQWKDTREGWVKEIKADKEFGGDNFGASKNNVNKTLRQFDVGGEFAAALKGSFDNHPATYKLLARVGAALGEDDVHMSREAGKGKDIPLHERLWKKEDHGFGVNT